VEDESLPSGWYGGTKFLETNLFIGAFNFLNKGKLLEHIRTIDFLSPEDVQLIIQEQEDTRFHIINVFDEEGG